jgi:hypothetical protein
MELIRHPATADQPAVAFLPLFAAFSDLSRPAAL